MLKNSIFFCFLIIGLSLYAQENPAIDKNVLLSLPGNDAAAIKKDLKQGDKYYKKGLYDAALLRYMRLYNLLPDYSPLNYKIGVSNLGGINPKNALAYFNQAEPAVASDYYCRKGIALIYNQQYKEAKEAFYEYLETLPPRQVKKETKKINRYIAICDLSEAAFRDSLPVFVINLGPNVNSYYDDYSAVALATSTPSVQRLFFTSRRPKDNEVDLTDRSEYRERILISHEFADGQASAAQFASVKSSKHIGVSGRDPEKNALLFYEGKKRFGDLYSVRFKDNGRVVGEKRLKRKISKKTSKESSICIAENGDAYFVSDRRWGEGGKDIWYAKKKGKRNYKRPKNIGSHINTPLTEEGVSISPDGNTLYFSSNGRPGLGGFDVYKVQKTQYGAWGDPVNMGWPINSPDDDLFYRPTSDTTIALLSSQRSGGLGGLDLYIVRKDLRIPFELSGDVRDVATKKILAATVKLFDKLTNLPVASADNDSLTGRYVLQLEDVGDYYLQAEAPGYRSVVGEFTNPTKRYEKLVKDFELERLLHPFTLSGYVTNLKSGRPVQAELILKPIGQDTVLHHIVSDEKSGFYTVTLEDKIDVDLTVKAVDYFDINAPLQLKQIKEAESVKNIALQSSIVTYVLTGIISEEQSNTPIRANIRVTKTGEPAVQNFASADDGKYELSLAGIGPFLLEITADGYAFVNSVVQFDADSTLVVRNFTMKKGVLTYTLAGVITEEGSNIPIKANIKVNKTGESAAQNFASGEDGKYEFSVTDAGPFLLEITSEGYFFVNNALQFDASQLIVRNFEMKKLQIGAKVVVEHILFKTGNATLRTESYGELNKLANLLKENPNIKIEVSGHTDNVGSAATNKKLSKNRALSVKKYLVSQGVASERVEYEGYGFDRPIAPNDTEEGRAANRRVEIEILD
jgi:outer membrane protein OmpA-like peptidoglycan-associated protein/tetratricopeptide (TPR) repeat protein